MFNCSCLETHAITEELTVEEEADLLLEAERQLVQLRWTLQRARSATEQEVQKVLDQASKTCASVSRAQPELAEEIVHAITAVKANSETVKVEADAPTAKQVVASVDPAEAQTRRDAVAAFLKKHGFSAVSRGKRSLLSTTYPLHKAVKLGDARMVGFLLLEGAVKDQKDSSGRTPAQLAKGNETVLAALQPQAGGGA
ncbi:unnamed protein product [Effrenium voratum]|nr:unnamed protein product [Effrenium voratum]